jgi:hypothetical protein
MEKICLFYQPCGLGDILFLQKLHYIWREKGFHIVHPVVHEYEWLSNYIKKSDFPSWMDQKNKITGPPLPSECVFPYKEKYTPTSPDIFTDDFVFLNFFKSTMPGRIMAGKYEQYNIKFDDWNEYINIERNKEKEKYLYYEICGLKDNEPYIFFNNAFCMRPEIFRANIPYPTDYRAVELKILPEYSLFDWLMIIERAQEIHMIETSLNYILEIPSVRANLKAKKMCLYHRGNNFNNVRYLFKINWEYKNL